VPREKLFSKAGHLSESARGIDVGTEFVGVIKRHFNLQLKINMCVWAFFNENQ